MMNVTELREALQKLEAEGHGQLKVAYPNYYRDELTYDEINLAETHVFQPQISPGYPWEIGQSIVLLSM